MRLLKSAIHPDVDLSQSPDCFERHAARGIIIRQQQILLMYTARYDDYSLPGGGIDAGESTEQGLIRELEEETGAREISILAPFGRYEEYRPWYRDDYDVCRMHSYCYLCQIAAELAEPRFEPYEIANGMQVRWCDIHQAIAHNRQVIAGSDKKGLSIERETWLLEQIARELMQTPDTHLTAQAA